MLAIGYQVEQLKAVFQCSPGEELSDWYLLLRRVLEDHTRDIETPSAGLFLVPWWSFLNARSQVLQIIRAFSVRYEIDAKARELLKEANARQHSFAEAKNAKPIESQKIETALEKIGFKRKLKSYQLRNVGKLASLPAAATFSVPGAGKTTEALAYFFLRSSLSDRLLVVAPKNAFAAWDEQLRDCLDNIGDTFTRLRGGVEGVKALLEKNPKFMLITYQQLTRVADLVARFVSMHDVFVFLDESHRIKGGRGKATADAVLRLSYLPKGKLIMSGTPMPQSEEDLLPQLAFLYPEIEADSDSVRKLVKPIYVRTTKAELGLKEPTREVINIEMNDYQARLYNLMKYEVARVADETLSIGSKSAFRALGRSVMRLLQFVSNPALLSKELGFAHEELLMSVIGEGDSRKVAWAVSRARQLARDGKKSIIWTTFRENVEVIAYRLSDLKAVYIHGSVDAGDEDDEDTREGKIRLFHDDKDTFVMVANPAAAAEGISLHKVCHNAIYVDRSYNAAHYLQSEDRIHRLGLDPSQTTTVEILECPGTIDESVRLRLGSKVRAMAEVLEDSSLNIDPIILDQYELDDGIEGEVGTLDMGDVQSLVANIRGSA